MTKKLLSIILAITMAMCLLPNTAFTKSYEYIWDIPIEITVVQGGSAEVPTYRFQFELISLDGDVIDVESSGGIAMLRVSTSGVGTTATTIGIIGDEDLYTQLSDGFILALVNSGDEGWEYDDKEYYVVAYFDEGTLEITDWDNDNELVDAAAFTCTYTAEKHNHTAGSAVTENYISPTCTTNGSYEAVIYCAECGEELIRRTVTVKATGHSYIKAMTLREATCDVSGLVSYFCLSCYDRFTVIIPATGHTYNVKGICTSCGAIGSKVEIQTLIKSGTIEFERTDTGASENEKTNSELAKKISDDMVDSGSVKVTVDDAAQKYELEIMEVSDEISNMKKIEFEDGAQQYSVKMKEDGRISVDDSLKITEITDTGTTTKDGKLLFYADMKVKQSDSASQALSANSAAEESAETKESQVEITLNLKQQLDISPEQIVILHYETTNTSSGWVKVDGNITLENSASETKSIIKAQFEAQSYSPFAIILLSDSADETVIITDPVEATTTDTVDDMIIG